MGHNPYHLFLRTLCDTGGKRGDLGTEDPGLDTGRENFDVKLGCKWEKHKKT